MPFDYPPEFPARLADFALVILDTCRPDVALPARTAPRAVREAFYEEWLDDSFYDDGHLAIEITRVVDVLTGKQGCRLSITTPEDEVLSGYYFDALGDALAFQLGSWEPGFWIDHFMAIAQRAWAIIEAREGRAP